MNWSASAKTLAEARLNDVRLDDPPRPDPQNTEEAYALQDAVTQELGFEVIGWKVGATNPAAQSALGANEPFIGPVFKERTFEGTAELKTAADALRIPEAEFALMLKADLPPRSAAYGASEVAAAVGSIHPAIEVVNKRLAGSFGDHVNRVIADGGANHAFIYGKGTETFDPIELASHAISVTVNGMNKAAGGGGNVMGSPLNVLAWLANHMSKRGIGLKAGQWVSTGLTTEVFQVRRGDTVVADFGTFGSVSVTFLE
ncbi:hypothetical protein EOI86_19280 [Hwanghaeella grinnelliae]|uniref:2-keto-4-pentenoate hydratase n=1 Tax=Hwanghaeella grinnelliae TaxID=2500179 RepID=A0A437QKD7_9PROT|nr:hypothetical protein [Hwanghaeella grinnelliae]RVU34978.1 hypothetical protein EOI86_19280 [Hwanghaeella grinnelliae]